MKKSARSGHVQENLLYANTRQLKEAYKNRPKNSYEQSFSMDYIDSTTDSRLVPRIAKNSRLSKDQMFFVSQEVILRLNSFKDIDWVQISHIFYNKFRFYCPFK